MSKIYLVVFISFFSLINSLILIAIDSDFDLDIEYRFEKQETGWFKRGKLLFRNKDPVSNKSTISLNDFNFTPQMKTEVQKECILKGNYILQFTNSKDISERYYTSINPCNLVSSKFHDKIIINSMLPITPGKIKSLHYVVEEAAKEEYDDEDEEEIVQKQKIKNKISKIEISLIKELQGPIFLDEKNEKEEEEDEKKYKRRKKNEKPIEILKRYWYLIVIIILLSIFQIKPNYQS